MTPAPAEYRYPSFVADLYDHNPIIAGRTDVGFFVEAACAAGGPVLELGCGTGRILMPTAAAGCAITGLDLSSEMLDRCRAKLAREPREVQQRVELVQATMTAFDLGRTFKLITAPFRSFQHLPRVADQLACLACVHLHLAPGGRLILDLFHTDPRRIYDPKFLEESSSGYPEVALPDGRRLRMSERIVTFHPEEQANDVELIYNVTHPDGRAERFVMGFRVRYFFRYEVEHLLARAGFRVAALFGNHDGSPFSATSPEMIFIAEKQ